MHRQAWAFCSAVTLCLLCFLAGLAGSRAQADEATLVSVSEATESLSWAAEAAATAAAAAAAATAAVAGRRAGNAEAELMQWLVEVGAQVRVEVSHSAGGVRGLVAAAPATAGDVLVRIPLSAAVVLGSAEETAPELAVQLLRERYRTRPRYGPYFAVLPPPPPTANNDTEGTADAAAVASAPAIGWEASCVEEFPEEAVEALAGQDLRLLASSKREWMRQVWSGEARAVRLPLARAVPRRRIGLREFSWATCMVTSRSIAGPTGPDGAPSMLLIPLIDLANHCKLEGGAGQGDDGGSGGGGGGRVRSAPDQLRFRTVTETEATDSYGASGGGSGGGGEQGSSGRVLELVAGQDLDAGDEVCISYGDLRPDEALLYYGFLTAPPPPPLPPPLAAVDERQYDSSARPGKEPYSRMEAEAGARKAGAEAARLEARLVEAEADAAAALAGPALGCSSHDGSSPSQQCSVPTGGSEAGGTCTDSRAGGCKPACGGRSSVPSVAALQGTAVCLVASLNGLRVTALRAELGRVRALVDAGVGVGGSPA